MAKDVTVKFKGDTSDAEGAAQRLKEKITDIGETAAKGMMGAAVAGFAALVYQIKEGMAAAKEFELAEIKLATAMKYRGDVTGQATQNMVAFNAGLALSKGMHETELMSVERSLAMHGVRNEALEAATRATIGLAKVTGQDLESAAHSVARIMEGNVAVLERMGLRAHNTKEALEMLTKISREQSGELQTTTGQMKMLGEAFERIRREMFSHHESKDSWLYRVLVDTRAMMEQFREGALGLKDALFYGAAVAGAEAFRGPGDKALLAGSTGPIEDPRVRKLELGRELESKEAAIKQAKHAEDERNAEKNAAAAEKEEAKIAAAMHRLDEAAERKKKAELDRQNMVLKSEEEFTRKQQALLQARADYRAKLEDDKFEARLATMGRQQQEELRLKRAGVSLEVKAQQEANQQIEDLQKQAMSAGLQAMSGMISGMVNTALTGKNQFGDILKSMIGGLITQLGTMLVQLGTAAVIAGTVGTVVPFLGLITGGSAGIGVGLAAIAAGSVMIGVGNALGAPSGPGAAATAPSSGAWTSSGSSAPSPFGSTTSKPSSQPSSTTVVVHFDRGVIAAEPRRFARELKSYLERGGFAPGWGT